MFKTVAVRVCTSYLQHHLESLTEEDFGRHRQALSVKRSEKPKKLKDECAKYWGEIISQQYHFVSVKFIRTCYNNMPVCCTPSKVLFLATQNGSVLYSNVCPLFILRVIT